MLIKVYDVFPWLMYGQLSETVVTGIAVESATRELECLVGVWRCLQGGRVTLVLGLP